MDKEVLVKELQELLKENIKNCSLIVGIAENLQITNEQFFIDWEDALNKISTKDHSDK